jgi:hypothetical protein
MTSSSRAVGRLMLYRRQVDDIFEQTAAKKVPCTCMCPLAPLCVLVLVGIFVH